MILLLLVMLINVNANSKKDGLIYILMWTPANEPPFNNMEMEQKSFIRKKCQFQNCYITNNKLYFSDVRDFDVILFNSVNLAQVEPPHSRSVQQQYVFASRESPVNFPIPTRYKNLFNVTWTYRLDSDINFAFVVVKNKKGDVVGPKKDMNWIDFNKMKQTPESIARKLEDKKIAAAWFVSHCDTASQRELYVQKLAKELYKYGLQIDIFGWCGNSSCTKDRMDECYALLQREYFFYLAFENSICEDYVTEKLLTALKNFAVPIVYGGANYTRFMPDGMYLDAIALGQEKLAQQMNDIIADRSKYYDYFKWHNYYSYHATNDSSDTDEICKLCAFFNSDNHTIRQRGLNIYMWWLN